MNHSILIDDETEGQTQFPFAQWIEIALREETVDLPCEINVLLTDDAGIHAINLEMREVDAATDVLSFPMFELEEGEHPSADFVDPDSGLLPLGDMVISLERAAAQAEEFGHSLMREVCYLTVHSVLHLLGYDHMDEGEMKKRMRAHEETILQAIDMPR